LGRHSSRAEPRAPRDQIAHHPAAGTCGAPRWVGCLAFNHGALEERLALTASHNGKLFGNRNAGNPRTLRHEPLLNVLVARRRQRSAWLLVMEIFSGPH